MIILLQRTCLLLCYVLKPLSARQMHFPLTFVSHKTTGKTLSTLLRENSNEEASLSSSGLYRRFCEYAFEKLQESGLFVPSNDIPEELQGNQAPAKGMPEGSVVKMTTRALATTNPNLVSYARYALLETLVPSNATEISTRGIQVMNLVVFPSNQTSLPVLGVDFVSLPQDKHLLAMDIQPMTMNSSIRDDTLWKQWYETHAEQFEWGGDMPAEASKFFSDYALWTRQSGPDAVDMIQKQVFDAFCEHLDLYIQMLQDYEESGDEALVANHQDEYRVYRLKNDPARPMLQSLYGPEWTEQVLTQVLFPSNM